MKVVNNRTVPTTDDLAAFGNADWVHSLVDMMEELANTLGATEDGDTIALGPSTGNAIAITGTPTNGVVISGVCSSSAVLISGASAVGIAFTGSGCVRGITFDGITPPAGAGNYGQTIDCGWLAVDPGSGGSFGAKLMFSNTDQSGYTLYGFGIRARSYYAQANVVGFNCSGSAAVASSGFVMGGEFYLQNSGSYTINDAGGLPSCALHVKSWLAAACTQAASALWIDDESSVAATGGHRMVDITMNGSALVTDVFHIYGGDPGASFLFNFDTCDQGAGAFCVPGATVAGTPNVKLKCKFGSTEFVLQGYAT